MKEERLLSQLFLGSCLTRYIQDSNYVETLLKSGFLLKLKLKFRAFHIIIPGVCFDVFSKGQAKIPALLY